MKKPARSRRPRRHTNGNGLDALFDVARPIARETFEALLRTVAPFGPVRVESEDSSIHLHAGSAADAFAVVNPRKIGILLRLRSVAPMSSLRVLKAERVSAERVHNQILITHSRALDDELTGWLRAAYRLSADTG